MKCFKCGTDNPDSSTFCMSCGSALGAQAAPQADPDEMKTVVADYPASGQSSPESQFAPPTPPVQPAQPVQPVQPVQPTPPAQPAQPVQPVQPNQYAQPNQYVQPNQYAQPGFNQPNPYAQAPYNAPVNDPYNGHPMKWYKFLVFFALIASAVLNIINGIRYLTSGNYRISGYASGKEAKELIYMYAPGLRGADTFYAIALFISAVLLCATWYMLMKKKKIGPTLLCVSYGFNMVISIVYTIWLNAAHNGVLQNTASMTSAAIVSAVVSVVMIVVNIIYFKKRQDVFVN